MSLRPALPRHVLGAIPAARSKFALGVAARLDAVYRCAPRVGCATRATVAAAAVRAPHGLPPCARVLAQRVCGVVPTSRVFGRRARCRPATAAAQEAAGAAPEVDDDTLDQLIAIFSARPREDWRRMLAVSAEWPKLGPRVFARIEKQAAAAAGEQELALLKLRRTLGEVDSEIKAYAALFDEFLGAVPEEWEALLGLRRASITPMFFEYLQLRISALGDDKAELREELATAAARLLALVDAHDAAVKDATQLEESFNAFQNLLKDVSSYEEIDAKVAEITQRGELSPALMLTASKMYMSVKESPYTSEEVKDIMGHLYWRMKASMAELQPPAVRILKHILSLDDPAERQAALEQAFTPGPEMAMGQDDMLYTTPEAMMELMNGVIKTYETQSGRTSMAGQAAELMTPAVIERMRDVRTAVKKLFS